MILDSSGVMTEYDSPLAHSLIKLAREKERVSDTGDFTLPSRTIAPLLGVSHWEVWRFTRMLVFDGVLERMPSDSSRSLARYRLGEQVQNANSPPA